MSAVNGSGAADGCCGDGLHRRYLTWLELVQVRDFWNECVVGACAQDLREAGAARIHCDKDYPRAVHIELPAAIRSDPPWLVITLIGEREWRPRPEFDAAQLDSDLLSITGGLEAIAEDLKFDRPPDVGAAVGRLSQLAKAVTRAADQVDDFNPVGHRASWLPIPHDEPLRGVVVGYRAPSE